MRVTDSAGDLAVGVATVEEQAVEGDAGIEETHLGGTEMNVETYEVISIDEQHGSVINEQVSEEALALIETLGLQGQRSLIETRTLDGEEVQTRNPYRLMTGEEQAIFGTLMPNRVKLADYRDGPIPLRALQVAAHAKALDCFDDIEVWCPQPGRDDPILVGVTKATAENRWRGELRLLARWGDEVLLSLDELRDKAKPIIASRLRAAIAKARGSITAFESGLDDKIDAYLHGGENETAHIYGLNLGN
jgi:hypothetical protein